MIHSKFTLYLRTATRLQLLQHGDRSAQEPATRMGHILLFPCLFWEYIFWRRDNIGCMLLFLAELLDCCAVSESWSWWLSFFRAGSCAGFSQRTATTFVYIVLYFHFLFISNTNQLHLHDIQYCSCSCRTLVLCTTMLKSFPRPSFLDCTRAA